MSDTEVLLCEFRLLFAAMHLQFFNCDIYWLQRAIAVHGIKYMHDFAFYTFEISSVI